VTTVTRYKDRITIEGHSGYAPIGQDIVCAAVSVLVQTLIQSVESLTTDRITYDMQPGKVDIKFWCLSDPSKVLIDAFFIGIKGIAEAYPDNVKMTELSSQ
jgi:uncharacterized protein YsxB (DUF464 family)